MTQTDLNINALAVGQIWTDCLHPGIERKIVDTTYEEGVFFVHYLVFIQGVESMGVGYVGKYPAEGFVRHCVLTVK